MDERRSFYFNADHFKRYSSMRFVPIVEKSRISTAKKVFLPLYFEFSWFVRLADIAAESATKTRPCATGWGQQLHPRILTDGIPEWRIYLSAEGLWSIWADLRAAKLTELEYHALQVRAQDGLSRFLHELVRYHGAIKPAAQTAGVELLRRDQRQGLPATAGERE